MALAVAQVTGLTGTTGSTSASFGSPTTAGSLVTVGGFAFSASALAAGDVTDNKSNSYSLDEPSPVNASDVECGIWSNNAGTRGSSHQVTVAPSSATTTSIAICEVTGQATPAFDSTTKANNNHGGTSPYPVTAGGAISGNQIAFYLCTVNSASSGTWSQPGGYSNVFNDGSAANLTTITSYKIDETGTPTVQASWTGSGSTAYQVFATYKEAAGGAAGPFPSLMLPWQWTAPQWFDTPPVVTAAAPLVYQPSIRARRYPWVRRGVVVTNTAPPVYPPIVNQPSIRARRYPWVRRGYVTPAQPIPPVLPPTGGASTRARRYPWVRRGVVTPVQPPAPLLPPSPPFRARRFPFVRRGKVLAVTPPPVYPTVVYPAIVRARRYPWVRRGTVLYVQPPVVAPPVVTPLTYNSSTRARRYPFVRRGNVVARTPNPVYPPVVNQPSVRARRYPWVRRGTVVTSTPPVSLPVANLSTRARRYPWVRRGSVTPSPLPTVVPPPVTRRRTHGLLRPRRGVVPAVQPAPVYPRIVNQLSIRRRILQRITRGRVWAPPWSASAPPAAPVLASTLSTTAVVDGRTGTSSTANGGTSTTAKVDGRAGTTSTASGITATSASVDGRGRTTSN